MYFYLFFSSVKKRGSYVTIWRAFRELWMSVQNSEDFLSVLAASVSVDPTTSSLKWKPQFT